MTVPILIDGRPIRIPVSGVARYCLSLANALTKLQDSGDLPGVPPVELLVQDEGGTNPTLAALDVRVARADLKLFGKRRKTQNIVTEFFPKLASRTALK